MPDIALIVPSCDAYADLWKPFFHNLRRKWPGLPFPIYLVANERPFDFPGVTVVHVGPDRGWSANLKVALDRIPAEAVFLLVDDLFPVEPVDRQVVERLCRRFVDEGMNYLRFQPWPGPVGPVDADGIGEVPPGAVYRASAVVCLWRRDVLREVLRDGESPWEFEIHGSARTDRFDRWHASSRWLLRCHNLVVKGAYEPVARARLLREGVPLATGRPVMTWRRSVALRAAILRQKAFFLLPGSWQRRIRSRFRAA